MKLEHVCPKCKKAYAEDWGIGTLEPRVMVYMSKNTMCPQCSAIDAVLSLADAMEKQNAAEEMIEKNPTSIPYMKETIMCSAQVHLATEKVISAARRCEFWREVRR